MPTYYPSNNNYTPWPGYETACIQGNIITPSDWTDAYRLAERYDPVNGRTLMDQQKTNPKWASAAGDPCFEIGDMVICVLNVMDQEW